MPGLCNYIMNQMDKQNRIDGLREAVESGDLEQAIGDVPVFAKATPRQAKY